MNLSDVLFRDADADRRDTPAVEGGSRMMDRIIYADDDIKITINDKGPGRTTVTVYRRRKVLMFDGSWGDKAQQLANVDIFNDGGCEVYKQ